MPELQVVADAIRSLLDACASIRARHEEALRKHSQGVLVARQLGIGELPDTRQVLAGHAGRTLVMRAAARASRDWHSGNPGAAVEFNGWLPNFNDPWAAG